MQKWILYLWILKIAKHQTPRLSLNLTDNIDLKKNINILLYQILVFIIDGKI